jgi:hypothetical protein
MISYLGGWKDSLTGPCPLELAIGNVVRRVLFIIREEHANAIKTPAAAPSSHSSYQSRSLGSILTPGTDSDLSTPIADLKSVRAFSNLQLLLIGFLVSYRRRHLCRS